VRLGDPLRHGQTEAGARFAAAEKTLADERAAQLAKDLESIKGDNLLSQKDKDRKQAEMIEEYKADAAKAADALDRYKITITQQESALQRAAALALKEGEWGLARLELASAEKMAAAKAQVDRELKAVEAFVSMLNVENVERSRRAASAADVFKTLATLAPQDQLRSAFYLLRGQAPPASATTTIPPGLFAALGVNPDTASAAAEQLRGSLSIPPWMSKLMGGA